MVLLRLCIFFFSNMLGSVIITLLRRLCLTNLLSLDFKVALISSLNITPESCHLILIIAYLLLSVDIHSIYYVHRARDLRETRIYINTALE